MAEHGLETQNPSGYPNTLRPVALLDVDDTLVLADNRLNTPLLEELLNGGITDIYLFTSMSLSDISAAASDVNYFSRQDLINHLTGLGFTVHGVITPIDPVYNKGLGAAYRDIFLPHYNRIGQTDHPLTEKDLAKDIPYQLACCEFELYSVLQDVFNNTITGKADSNEFKKQGKNQLEAIKARLDALGNGTVIGVENTQKYEELNALYRNIQQVVQFDSEFSFSDRIQTIATILFGDNATWFTQYYDQNRSAPKVWDKGAMALYFFSQKPDWVHGVLYCDDKQACLDTFFHIQSVIGASFAFHLLTVCFKKSSSSCDTNETYQDNIRAFWQKAYVHRIQLLSAATIKWRANQSFTRQLEHLSEVSDALCQQYITEGRFDDLKLQITLFDQLRLACHSPSEKTFNACLRLTAQLEGKADFRERLLGCVLLFLMALVILAGIFFIVGILPSFGFAAPLAIACFTVGVLMGVGGAYCLWDSRQQGLSLQVSEVVHGIKSQVNPNAFFSKSENHPTSGMLSNPSIKEMQDSDDEGNTQITITGPEESDEDFTPEIS